MAKDMAKESRQAGTEIEVTPEMVKAAMDVFFDELYDELTGEVYLSEVRDVCAEAIRAAILCQKFRG